MSDTAKQAAPKAKADQIVPEADVKQGEPETVTEASPADEAEAAPAQPDMDEMKRKFREALMRKKQASTNDSAASGARGTGKAHGAGGPATSRRQFRRKSG